MAPGEHRPLDEDYWIPAWSSVLFSGDLFEAIPFGGQPVQLYEGEDELGETKHFLGEVGLGYGLLISPTCDMVAQKAAESQISHPYRVLVPVLPLAEVVAEVGALKQSVGLLRGRDSIGAYMYLPPLADHLPEESVACLFRPSLVSDEYLREPPKRVAQLHPEARRQLKIKLAAYWGRVAVDRDDLPLHEHLEDDVRSTQEPVSPYDV